MFQKRWIVMALLISFGAKAQVSFEEKQNRVEYLEELSKTATSMNIEAWRRELSYERQDLTLKERAKNEANLLAETIKNQIAKAYDASLLTHGDPNQAQVEIREAIEKDLELVDSEIRDELKTLAFETLENVQRGEMSASVDLIKTENMMLNGVRDRAVFLNQEFSFASREGLVDKQMSAPDLSNDANKISYKTKNEILSSLVSDGESTSSITTGAVTLKSTTQTQMESKINLQVKVEFLGVGIGAGPVITFKREYSTLVNIQAAGLNPVLLSDGNFDLSVTNKTGKIQKRIITFACESTLNFETEYAGQGGFSVAGVGASTSIGKKYVNNVNLTSRRIAVPEDIDGKTVTYKYLTDLCHRDFLNARVTNNLTVSGSLNMMMKNVVAGLRFSHPKTKCATDNHCVNWYNKEVLPLVRIGNFPRCVEEGREKYRACALRGLKGQNCAVFDSQGKRISDGMFEFVCDKGLKCVQTQEAGWFKSWDLYQYAKGKCMPADSKTYKSPIPGRSSNVLYVDLTR